ncbi:MAG TPA: redox-regulated ATPase YchF [Planctomycetota bacterium]|nr:redox-regulated ATPase YchF [Planctomycetota bacterium]
MGFKCGIVGLPNVGKSTIFNAITATQQAQAANYPFCTIEPNVGTVPLPDPRLDVLARIAGSEKVVRSLMQFVDIAGLVRGASKGEGLGNQFLSHIREVDAVAHVVRCFEDPDVIHVDGAPDPARDVAVIDLELALKDLETVRARKERTSRAARSGDKAAKAETEFLEAAEAHLDAGRPMRTMAGWKDDADFRRLVQKDLALLTAKPTMYVANVAESALPDGEARLVDPVRRIAAAEGAETVVISGQIEAEAAQLADAERDEFLASLGLGETGLAKLIRTGYALLGLRTFFTAGPKEARAWTIHAGATAPQAAGVIHTDFERGFIRAETVAYDDYVACRGEQGAREAGKLRIEGKAYVVQDGDVMHFRFNV